MRDGKPQPVPVKTGLSDDSYVEITGDSLKQGDQVIVNEIAPNAANEPARRSTLMRF
jgi:multidrug efflux pump subunit AcrA (membrane-fusion protein)